MTRRGLWKRRSRSEAGEGWVSLPPSLVELRLDKSLHPSFGIIGRNPRVAALLQTSLLWPENALR